MEKQYKSKLDSLKQLGSILRLDNLQNGWSNMLTGINIKGKDKRVSAEVNWVRLTESDVENLYAADDVAGRVVELPPSLGLRNGIKVKIPQDQGGNEKAKEFNKELERLQVMKKLRQGEIWARMYGGAGLFINANDSADLSKPLNINSISQIKNFTVLQRWELHPYLIDYSLGSNNFMKPELYYLSPRSGARSKRASQYVHHTRVIRLDGVELPRRLHVQNNYWGDSVLTRLYNILRNFNLSHDSVSSITQDFRVGVLKLRGLSDIIANGDKELLEQRIETMGLTKSVLGSILLDAEDEEYTNLSSTLNGMDTLLDKINQRLVVATGLPHTLVLGEGASGVLSGAGESENRQLFQYIESYQKDHLQEPLSKIIELIQKQKQGPTNGEIIEEMSWQFNPLEEKSEAQQAELRNKQAQTDVLYLDRGVVDPEEVRDSRFGGDEYSIETHVKEDDELPEQEFDE